MKTTKIVWMALCIGICLIFLSPLTTTAQVINLNFADQNSNVGWGPVHALQPWVKDVEKATKGRVKITVYPSQTLAKAVDMWNAVKTGIADIGWCFHGYWPGMTPLADVISLPGLPFTTAEQGSELAWKVYEKFPSVQEQFQDNKVLLLYTSNPYILMTTKKRVKTIEDMKGLKLRTPGGPPTDQMKFLGAVPMLFAMPDCYISLQKGVIDGMGAPWEAILAFKLYEVVKYYTEAPLPIAYFSISMNKNKWNNLPKDIQDAIMSVSGLKGAKFWGHNFFDICKQGTFDAAKKAGRDIDLYILPEAERARWVEVSAKPIWGKWINNMKAKGFQQAQEILDTAIKMAK